MLKAPWTAEQVNNLRKRQLEPSLHPYTCEKCGSVLYPKASGWKCSKNGCDYIQDWAHASDANGEFQSLADLGKKLGQGTRELQEGL